VWTHALHISVSLMQTKSTHTLVCVFGQVFVQYVERKCAYLCVCVRLPDIYSSLSGSKYLLDAHALVAARPRKPEKIKSEVSKLATWLRKHQDESLPDGGKGQVRLFLNHGFVWSISVFWASSHLIIFVVCAAARVHTALSQDGAEQA